MTLRDHPKHPLQHRVHTALALYHLKGVGPSRLATALRMVCESATDPSTFSNLVRSLSLTRSPAPPSDKEIKAAWARAADSLENCRREHIAVLVIDEENFPASLQDLKKPPALLFVKGMLSNLAAKPRVTIAGTRDPSEWGTKTAQRCAKAVAEAGGIVVSGLARGIDAAAHRAALKAGGVTWAVLAHGLDRVSPVSNRGLAEEILDKDAGGAIVSEYPPGVPARRAHFVERNRIQAALGQAVLIVESDTDGGSMHTAKFAQDLNRPVWVTLPSGVDSRRGGISAPPKTHRGPLSLLAAGARRITDPSDLRACLAKLHQAKRDHNLSPRLDSASQPSLF